MLRGQRSCRSYTPAKRRIGYNADGTPASFALQQVVTTGLPDAPLNSSVQSMATSGTLGELFQYTVGNVTLGRQKSAMLPIITDSVQAERVSIYNEATLRSNPLNGVWMKNTTGKHLLQGPVTVLEKSGYAGDARIDDVPPGQDRLLSYGIDLDVSMNTTKRSTETVTAARISQGLLIVSRRKTMTADYAADNKSEKDKMLVIEHPSHSGWHLVDTRAPFETTPTIDRFKGTAPANKVTTLTVTEEDVDQQGFVMSMADSVSLRNYYRSGAISKDVKDAIDKTIQLKLGVADLEQQLNAKLQQINNITAEQTRIRENMKAVAPAGPYYDRLLAKLNEQETSIEKLQADLKDMAAKRAELQKGLEDYLRTLNIG